METLKHVDYHLLLLHGLPDGHRLQLDVDGLVVVLHADLFDEGLRGDAVVAPQLGRRVVEASKVSWLGAAIVAKRARRDRRGDAVLLAAEESAVVSTCSSDSEPHSDIKAIFCTTKLISSHFISSHQFRRPHRC